MIGLVPGELLDGGLEVGVGNEEGLRGGERGVLGD